MKDIFSFINKYKLLYIIGFTLILISFFYPQSLLVFIGLITMLIQEVYEAILDYKSNKKVNIKIASMVIALSVMTVVFFCAKLI